MYDVPMAKRARPAQGNQTNKKFPVTLKAGGDNVNTGGKRAPRVNNGAKRRAT